MVDTQRMFMARVAEAARETPYGVSATPRGFDVALKIADAQWYGLFNKAGLRKTYIHHVAVEGDTYTISDDSREVRWVAGVPRLAVRASRQYGRLIQVGAEKVFALDENGRLSRAVDYRYDSEEGCQLVTLVGREMDLRQKQPTSVRIGIAMAVFAVGGLVLLGLGTLVWFLFLR